MRPAGPPPRPGIWQVAEAGRPVGMLVVDRLVAGRACGGLRIAPGVTSPELSALAATMTLKFAFVGIACGGAKSGVDVPPDAPTPERRRRVHALGREIAPLLADGRYIAGTDLGCDEGDLWDLFEAAGLRRGRRPTATATARRDGTASWSGHSAAVAAIAALRGRGQSMEGASLAVAGYGRVGSAVARRFVAAGGRLVAASTQRGAVVDRDGIDLRRFEALRASHGDDAPLRYAPGHAADPDEVLTAPVDVLAPCAGWRMVDATRARRLRCQVVSPGANAAVTPDAEAVLVGNGVTVIPDFVANAGGVLVGHFWPMRLPASAVGFLLDVHFRALVERVLAATAPGTPPSVVARAAAESRLQRVERSSPDDAIRHERWIGALGRSRIATRLPDLATTMLVRRLARALA